MTEIEEEDDGHPGPGYELICDHDPRWSLYRNRTEGVMVVRMPEEDSAEIEALAKAESVTVEVYLRRRLGLPDEPTPENTSRQTTYPSATNDDEATLYRDMAHVKFFSELWDVSCEEVMEIAAEALDHEISWDDVQYRIAAVGQHTNKLWRGQMAGKKLTPDALTEVLREHGWNLLLVGEVSRRTGTRAAMKEIASLARQFQESVALIEAKAVPQAFGRQ